ncbi:MAG: hypothetical protein HXY43_16500, partial [Fischerella sp.]|uniref:hypothetical protein n=1 Tax=Fischerella sp. TaxID=1191 RepID=UPI0018499A72
GGQDAPKFRTLWEAARRASTEEASARTSLHPTILLKLLWAGLLARTVFSLFMPFYRQGVGIGGELPLERAGSPMTNDDLN